MAYIVDVVAIEVTDEFRDWYEGLDEATQASIFKAVAQLEERGVALAFPLSSAVRGSKTALRELRVQHGGKPYRIFYAFDPKRQAILVLGGCKAGVKRFYEQMVPKADAIWEQYLEEIDEEEGRA